MAGVRGTENAKPWPSLLLYSTVVQRNVKLRDMTAARWETGITGAGCVVIGGEWQEKDQGELTPDCQWKNRQGAQWLGGWVCEQHYSCSGLHMKKELTSSLGR
jgi:hypothetical protein